MFLAVSSAQQHSIWHMTCGLLDESCIWHIIYSVLEEPYIYGIQSAMY